MEAKSYHGQGFPSARLRQGNQVVEVMLIEQLAPGLGNRLIHQADRRQRFHPSFNDALDEPSALLAEPDWSRDERSSIFSFSVDYRGHPFHRHAGHRMFTAIAGAAGTQLRFSFASQDAMQHNPASFIEHLHCIHVPAGSLFCVRFSPGVWHQFMPLSTQYQDPALFALSFHADESGGHLSPELRQQVQAGIASLADLTDVLPSQVQSWLDQHLDSHHVPTHQLSFEYASDASPSLLDAHFTIPIHHQDSYSRRIKLPSTQRLDARGLMSALLEGFVHAPPASVSCLMQLRNALVFPLGLRRAQLGCPVSSLLSGSQEHLFDNSHPVLAQHVSASSRQARVLLGADDKHLKFRTEVLVQIVDEQTVSFTLTSRVHCHHWFGHVYIRLIAAVHEFYIAPTLLKAASRYARDKLTAESHNTLQVSA